MTKNNKLNSQIMKKAHFVSMQREFMSFTSWAKFQQLYLHFMNGLFNESWIFGILNKNLSIITYGTGTVILIGQEIRRTEQNNQYSVFSLQSDAKDSEARIDTIYKSLKGHIRCEVHLNLINTFVILKVK